VPRENVVGIDAGKKILLLCPDFYNMKLFPSLFGVTLLLCVAACKKKEETTPAAASAPALISARVDGASWKADSVTAELQDEKTFVIKGKAADNSTITLVCRGTSLNEYDLASAAGGYGLYSSPELLFSSVSSTGGIVTSGKLILTHVDKVQQKISGTFRFLGVETLNHQDYRTITEGTFTDISYVKKGFEAKPHVFSAKVNGVPYVPDTIFVTNAVTGTGVQVNTRGGAAGEFVLNLAGNTPGTYMGVPYYSVEYGKIGLYSSSNVTITVASYDAAEKRLQGTFSFTANGNIAITEGSFTIYR
jgi:hypothetical protein